MEKLTCPHGEDCGACAHLGMPYPDQLRRKRQLMREALAEHRSLRETEVLPTLPSPSIGAYRNRAKMAVAISRDSTIRVGYFRAGTRQVVDAPDCRVLVPELLETTRRLRRFLATNRKIPRELRHLDLRCGTDPMRQHLTLVFRSTECPPFPLDRLRRSCTAIDGISINLNPGSGPQVIRGAIRPTWGRREIWVDCAGLRLRVSPGAFFQVNLELLPAIHRIMGEFLRGGDVLADLYAGVGTHGLALRERFRHVFFAEGTRSAVADLKATVRQHGVKSVEIAGTAVERSLQRIRDQRPEAVVLNPSRAGADASVLEAIASTPAERIAYLSCEPATLCRDLELLGRKGFKVRSVQPIDMMPQTGQVEAVALLQRDDARDRRPARGR
jgi:23S rRNA (uracil1939-C5)-methyltransferase